jgi:hypothetical protein
MKEFDVMYFTSIDERTPHYIRERTLKLRDEDVYFDANDKLIRASLLRIYPHLKGYETCILKQEISNPPSIDILQARKESFVVIGQEYSEVITLTAYNSKNPSYHFHSETIPVNPVSITGDIAQS